MVYTFAGINLNGVIDSLDYHNDINLGKIFELLKAVAATIRLFQVDITKLLL